MKPFLRYAGGKRQLLKEILPRLPATYSTYHEPFLGGGALFFHLEPTGAVVNDMNVSLMMMYKTLAQHPAAVVEQARRLIEKFDDAHYKKMRAKFNQMRPEFVPERGWSEKKLIEFAAILIYLNRTGYNGLWRENSKGGYNTPKGKFSRGPTLDLITTMDAARVLRQTTMMYLGFGVALTRVRSGDFVFADPPYAPVEDGSFTKFQAADFRYEDQVRLAQKLRDVAERGAHVMLTNNLTPATRELFGWMVEHEVHERRAINSATSDRKGLTTAIWTSY